MELEPGQMNLIDDLEDLLKEAKAGEFGDFTNEKYETPKIELKNKLTIMAQKVLDGEYD